MALDQRPAERWNRGAATAALRVSATTDGALHRATEPRRTHDPSQVENRVTVQRLGQRPTIGGRGGRRQCRGPDVRQNRSLPVRLAGYGQFMGTAPLLTVVTVVFNDPEGLRQTLASVRPHLGAVEHWVIDGSTTDGVRQVVRVDADDRVKLLSEPDHGLYDAMNKGLDRATGDYVLFLNAGDVLHSRFDPAFFLQGEGKAGRVLLAFCIERYGADRYLRPAQRMQEHLFDAPAHPATAYPRAAYEAVRFDTTKPVAADAYYTRDAIALSGAVIVREVVSEFSLGGRSTSYGDLAVVRSRLRDAGSPKRRVQLLAKTAAWFLLPRRRFYRLLATRTCDALAPEDDPVLDDRGAVAGFRRSLSCRTERGGDRWRKPNATAT